MHVPVTTWLPGCLNVVHASGRLLTLEFVHPGGTATACCTHRFFGALVLAEVLRQEGQHELVARDFKLTTSQVIDLHEHARERARLPGRQPDTWHCIVNAVGVSWQPALMAVWLISGCTK